MIKKEKFDDVYPYNIVEPVNLSHLPEVKGFDFDDGFDFEMLVDSYRTTGFQATNLGAAVDIANQMINDKATIFLSCTSNIISSGLRDIVRYLAKHKKIHFIVTTAGGIEEDIIKCLKPFHIGSFDVKGKLLFDRGVARIGNIFVPSDRYAYFERFLSGFFESALEKQKSEGRPLCTSEIIHMLGEKVGSEDSVLYWAAKNNIPVVCPAIMDGSFGDLAHFFKMKNPDFCIDSTGDTELILKHVQNAEKSGVVCLGAGVPKHYVLNANIFRDGVDYAVIIATGDFSDGSDSGAFTEESITWAKIKPDAMHVKVHADASIAFPIIAAASFAKKH